MSADSLEPGVEINPGPVTVPRLAATVILLRGDGGRLEVLLAKRTPAARFMAGAWVFPGGAVGPEDGSDQRALPTAGARELREEVGITLPIGAELLPFSNWITPPDVPIRFDTWFFLAAAPSDAEPVVDGNEIVDARWFEPGQALSAAARDEILLVFPTVKHLEQIAGFESVDELLSHARGREIQPVQPRVLGSGETARIVLPGEPGYDA